MSAYPTRRRPQHAHRADGVTLLELLVAVAVFGVVASIVYGTFARTLAARAAMERTERDLGAARAVLDWLSQDLAGSFGSGLYPGGGKRFFSIGTADATTRGSTPLLDVTTVSALGLPPLIGRRAETSERPGRSEQVRVIYHLEEPEEPSAPGLALVRYEQRPPLDTELEEARRAVVARGLESIRLRFFDGAAWHDSWDSLARGGPQSASPPLVVEIRVRTAGATTELVGAIYVPLARRHG